MGSAQVVKVVRVEGIEGRFQYRYSLAQPADNALQPDHGAILTPPSSFVDSEVEKISWRDKLRKNVEEESMRRLILLLASLILLASTAWSDEFELGMGVAVAAEKNDAAAVNSTQDNNLYALRLAYNWLNFVNFSLDSIVLPPASVQQMTGRFTFDPKTGNLSVVQGIYRPGMVNMIDVGIKFALFDFIILGVQVGGNSLYIYHMDKPEDKPLFAGINTDLGANIKATVGMKFNHNLGLEIAMYSIQPSLETSGYVLGGLISEDSKIRRIASGQLLRNAAFGAVFVLYL
jgi:hypothetical protein